MKVTRLIREYVEEQVSKVYDAKQNPYSEQAEIDRQKLKALEEELRVQQRKTIEHFISENELFEDRWDGTRPYEMTTTIPSFYYVYTKAILDEKKWALENKKAKIAKIREIMLNLELGANRQELNDMIAKLMEDDKC